MAGNIDDLKQHPEQAYETATSPTLLKMPSSETTKLGFCLIKAGNKKQVVSQFTYIGISFILRKDIYSN